MDNYHKPSYTAGSQGTGEEYSVLSPNKSNVSNSIHYGIPSYHPGIKENNAHSEIFPNIVQDLLNGTEEWRNIQDIIRMTLKALCEVIRDQGMSIKFLEKTLATKANKAEINSALDTKANISDVSNAITEVASQLEYKASLEEVNAMVHDKMGKSELQYLLTNKVSIDEMRSLMENKSNVHEVNQKFQSLDRKIEQYFDDFKAKQQTYALQKDLSNVLVQLELKADLNDVNESFSEKANKSTVAGALHRKANKGEVDDALELKVDKKDLHEILDNFKKDVEHSQIIGFSKQKETLVKIDHFKELEDIILRKADKAEIDMYLSAVNTQKKDFDRRIHLIEKETSEVLKTVQMEIETMRTSCIETLNRKADLSEIDRLNEEVITKLNTESVIELINKAKSDLYIAMNEIKEDFAKGQKKYEDSLLEKASRAEISSAKIAEDIHITRKEIEELRQISIGVEKDTIAYSKNMYESSRKEMGHELSRMENNLESFRTEISHKLDNSLSVQEFDKYKQNTSEVIENKVDVEEVQRAITGCQNDAINRIDSSKEEVLKTIDELNGSLIPNLESKIDSQDLEARIANLVTKNELTSELEESNSHLIKDIRNLYSITEKKTDLADFEHEREKIREILENIENDLGGKMNDIDARDLISQKCSIDDVNKALTEVHNELDTKSNVEELQSHTKMQTEINQALCAENCVARWIWKSGDLKSGFAIPWEIESINTCPENFLWEQDKANIMTVAPGLYEITFGFFSKKKPTVQLLVNGEPCLSAVNNASYVIHHSSGKLKSSNKHKEGNITGLTLIDFVALPARARISVSFKGESTSEGFMGLRKL
ncbi:unnamed protein product [Moneuplotes crassus]|uniref:C1q domain-containing protein n=1 Tax=Euplotes crassus TaxID=5936 RepID=A0AAD1Y5I8_EUPCR|nr:unnamed protein product [Moneuplotes crassus]